MKKNLLFIIMFVLSVSSVFGQNSITVNVTDKDSAAFAGADVILTDASVWPNVDIDTVVSPADGVVAFSNLDTKNYKITVHKDGYIDVSQNYSTWDMPGDFILDAIMLLGYDVVVTVNDDSGNPLEGISLNFNSTSVTTDANGEAAFFLPDGNYSYDINKQGYTQPENVAFTVNGASLAVPVTLTYIGFTETITVRDNSWTAISGAEVIVSISGGTVVDTIISGVDGKAIFTGLDPDSYTLTVTATGYAPYAGTFTISKWNGSKSARLDPVYQLTINVTDGTNVIDAVAVTIGGATVNTDVNGDAIFTDMPTGVYEYSAYKSGWAPAPLVDTVEIADADRSKTISLVPAYNITFLVTSDGTTPINGAAVIIGGDTILTDASGNSVFTDYPNATYNYTVHMSGYADAYGSVTVVDANITVPTITLLTGYDVVFTVTSSAGGAVENASVTFDGSAILTNAAGQATFGRADATTSGYTVTRNGYADTASITNITISGANVSEAVTFRYTGYEALFTVTNATGGAAVAGATITMGTNTYTTDASGQYNVTGLDPGTYSYTISMANFEDKTGSITVAQANITENVAIDPVYTVTINVTDGTNALVGFPVTNRANWQTINTDANGDAVFTLKDGTYDFSISKAGYDYYTNQVVVNGANVDSTFTLTYVGYNVKFVTATGGIQGIEVDVTFNGKTQTTAMDFWDMATTFTGTDNGTYQYSITGVGWEVTAGEVTVADADQTLWISDIKPAWDVKFVVSDGSNALEGASITMDAVTQSTDVNGQSVYAKKYLATYNYTISKAGHADKTGSVTVTDQDVTEIVVLDPYYTITFAVNDGANPIVGANVTIGSTTVVTDASGNAVFNNMLAGSYNYTVTATDYDNATGSVTLSNANVSENVKMVLTSYDITFTVNDGTNAINGASVTIGTTTLTTDASGNATFTGMVNGDYSYTVTATSYDNATGSVTVADANATETVSMALTTYSITFNVTDGTDAIENAAVTCDGTTVNTDAAGNAVFADKAPGDYTYTVTASSYTDASGSVTVADANVTEDVALSLTTGINDISAIKLEVYPNPTAGQLNVRLPSEVNGEVTINIISSHGKVVRRIEITGAANSVKTIELSDLPSGLYFINMKAENFETITKILKD